MRASAAVSWISKDRLALHCRDLPGSEPVVLCLHGLTRNGRDFLPFIEAASLRNRVLMPDQRGRGQSEWDSQPARYHPGTYVADTWALLDQLDVKRVVIVGTSMGGLMGLMMAAAAPHRIAGLVLNDIGPVFEPEGLARIHRTVGKTPVPTDWDDAVRVTRSLHADVFPGYDNAQWRRFTEGLFLRDDSGAPAAGYDPAIANALYAEPSEAPNLWPLFESVSVPMLLLRGEHSDILHRGTALEMQARQPTMGYVQIDGRGHAPMLDEPQALAAIQRFIGRLGAAR